MFIRESDLMGTKISEILLRETEKIEGVQKVEGSQKVEGAQKVNGAKQV